MLLRRGASALCLFLKGIKMAKEKKEEREISREERVTGKRPVGESVETAGKNSREYHATHPKEGDK